MCEPYPDHPSRQSPQRNGDEVYRICRSLGYVLAGRIPGVDPGCVFAAFGRRRQFETRARFGGTARATQANDSGVVVFQTAAVDCRIAPVHANGRGLQKVAHFPLEFLEGCRRDDRIRSQENDQRFLVSRKELSMMLRDSPGICWGSH